MTNRYCAHGENCSLDIPGHLMTFMRERVARASNKWRDGIILSSEGSGWHQIEILETGDVYLIWNHEMNLDLGDVVAINLEFKVLATGRESRFNVVVQKSFAFDESEFLSYV